MKRHSVLFDILWTEKCFQHIQNFFYGYMYKMPVPFYHHLTVSYGRTRVSVRMWPVTAEIPRNHFIIKFLWRYLCYRLRKHVTLLYKSKQGIDHGVFKICFDLIISESTFEPCLWFEIWICEAGTWMPGPLFTYTLYIATSKHSMVVLSYQL